MENINPFPNDKFETLPNLKKMQKKKFEIDKNSGKFTESVEKAVGKGEVARYEQFLLFPQGFQKTFSAKRVDSLPSQNLKASSN